MSSGASTEQCEKTGGCDLLKTELSIAVRTLVEFVCIGGDLTLAYSGAARSLDGIRGHQTVQRSRPHTYTAEVPVFYRVETERFSLKISGRIDGVYQDETGAVIDEIKTTRLDPAVLTQDPDPAHWAQARVYAYLYARQHTLDSLGVQLTYYQVGTGRTRQVRQTFQTSDLEVFFLGLVDRYLSWAATLAAWCVVRDASIRTLAFPHERFRPGQRDMAVAVYRAIRDHRQIIVQAATGIGKTLAALFPAVKALGEGKIAKIFYLTARTTGRSAAEQALDRLRGGGLRIRSATLTAKEKICFNPDDSCDSDACAFAKGHFDRVGGALAAAAAVDALTRDCIVRLSMEHRVCPFAFSLDLCLFADCVVCDYNYAFDPRVYLRRFFAEDPGAYTFLVDEAHNLVDRSREMFSAEIRKQPFLDLRRAVKGRLPQLYRSMGKVNTRMALERKACEAAGGVRTDRLPPEDLLPPLRGFLGTADRWLVMNEKSGFRKDLMELYFAATAFVRVLEQYDGTYVTVGQQSGRDFRLRLFCMDPSAQMKEALKRSRSTVFFSATLTPAEYFGRILGCDDGVRLLRIPSPFPPKNLGLFVADGISTLYRNRGRTAGQVAKTLAALVAHRQGNYLFYFPSYEYLALVHRQFLDLVEGIDIDVQTPEMNESEREAYVARFASRPSGTRVGFAVMGGIFGEGIDLVGDRLTGAAIVGVGLPGISVEREMVRGYFSAADRAGFAFAYLYPGINRVLQAAGRVIRTERDRGTVLLIDQRYTTYRYGSLLPGEWHPVPVRDTAGLVSELEAFWGDDAGSDEGAAVQDGDHGAGTPFMGT